MIFNTACNSASASSSSALCNKSHLLHHHHHHHHHHRHHLSERTESLSSSSSSSLSDDGDLVVSERSDCDKRGSCSILVVPTQEESVSPDRCEQLVAASRVRRQERLTLQRQEKSADVDPAVCCEDTKTKLVAFSSALSIRHYPIVIGNHPGGTTGGPSLSLGWEYFETNNVDAEVHEAERDRHQKERIMKQEAAENFFTVTGTSSSSRQSPTPRKRRRRPIEYLRIDPDDRTALLMRAGFSLDDIIDSKFRIQHVQRQRRQSLNDQASGRDFVLELKESLVDATWNVLTFGARRRNEQLMRCGLQAR